MALRPTDIRNFFMSSKGEQVLNWLLFEHHVFDANLDSPEDVALRNWGMHFLQLIGPKDSMSKAEWLRRALDAESDGNAEV